MSQIKGKKTSIEDRVCKYIFSKGFRYRKNVAGVPRKPNIVLKNIKLLFLYRAAFGIGIAAVKMRLYRKQEQIFGLKS